jgi:hypothetical protein
MDRGKKKKKKKNLAHARTAARSNNLSIIIPLYRRPLIAAHRFAAFSPRRQSGMNLVLSQRKVRTHSESRPVLDSSRQRRRRAAEYE